MHSLEEKLNPMTTWSYPFQPDLGLLGTDPLSLFLKPSRFAAAWGPRHLSHLHGEHPSSFTYSLFRPQLLGHPIPSDLPSIRHHLLFSSLFCNLSICKMLLLVCAFVQCCLLLECESGGAGPPSCWLLCPQKVCSFTDSEITHRTLLWQCFDVGGLRLCPDLLCPLAPVL